MKVASKIHIQATVERTVDTMRLRNTSAPEVLTGSSRLGDRQAVRLKPDTRTMKSDGIHP